MSDSPWASRRYANISAAVRVLGALDTTPEETPIRG